MPKVGDKFIIEIGEIYAPKDSNSNSPSFNLYRIEGFNSLVFDDFGIQKLLPYDAETIDEIRSKAYEHGRYDATILCEEESKAAYEKGLMHGRKEATESLTQDRIDEAYQRGVKTGQLAATGESYAQGLKDGYRKGQTEMWDWVGEYIPAKEDGGVIPVEDIQRIFAVEHFREIFKSFTPTEAQEIVRNYLCTLHASLPAVGDEVRYKGNPPSKPFVVTRVTVESTGCFVDGIYDNGSILEDGKFDLMEKTGRHFPIAALLEHMEAGNE